MPDPIPLVVHATHEAGVKLGGIGAVLDGLLGCGEYVQNVQRTVLTGPMLAGDQTHMERFFEPRNGVTVYYSSLHGISNVPEEMRAALQSVEQTFSIGLLYGVRKFGAFEHEILLVDVTHPNWDEANLFKFYTWQHTGFDARALQLGPGVQPLLHHRTAPVRRAQGHRSGLTVWVRTRSSSSPTNGWACRWSLPRRCLKPEQWRTVFYAHETATARRLVEDDRRPRHALLQRTLQGKRLGP